MIDCSHANSSKDPSRQPDVLNDVLSQIEGRGGCDTRSHVRKPSEVWCQAFPRPADQLDYGVSITDGCIGLEDD